MREYGPIRNILDREDMVPFPIFSIERIWSMPFAWKSVIVLDSSQQETGDLAPARYNGCHLEKLKVSALKVKHPPFGRHMYLVTQTFLCLLICHFLCKLSFPSLHTTHSIIQRQENLSCEFSRAKSTGECDVSGSSEVILDKDD